MKKIYTIFHAIDGVDNIPISMAFLTDDGYSFYAEFREFDPHMRFNNPDRVRIPMKLASTIYNLKYKDTNFMTDENKAPIWSISRDKSSNKYSMQIKGFIHIVKFELSAWVRKTIGDIPFEIVMDYSTPFAFKRFDLLSALAYSPDRLPNISISDKTIDLKHNALTSLQLAYNMKSIDKE